MPKKSSLQHLFILCYGSVFILWKKRVFHLLVLVCQISCRFHRLCALKYRRGAHKVLEASLRSRGLLSCFFCQALWLIFVVFWVEIHLAMLYLQITQLFPNPTSCYQQWHDLEWLLQKLPPHFSKQRHCYLLEILGKLSVILLIHGLKMVT